MAKRTRPASSKRVRGGSTPPRPKSLSRADIEIIARGCAVEASRVLLCRNIKHGYLYLPGGHVEFGESASQALAREFLEECGTPVRVGNLQLASEAVFATKKREHHEINLVFYVELRPGGASRGKRDRRGCTVVRSRESEISFEWIDLSAIVNFDIRPTSVKAWLMTLGSDGATPTEWVSEIR